MNLIAILLTQMAAAMPIAEAPAPAPIAPQAAAPAIERYVGKYPFDKVDGVAFLDHPKVRAAVEAVVKDAEVRKWVLQANDSPSPAIYRLGAEIVAVGCQAHACDARNWAILVDPGRMSARVCYFNGTTARWFPAIGRPLNGVDECRFDPPKGK
jgi:hypothetical protein